MEQGGTGTGTRDAFGVARNTLLAIVPGALLGVSTVGFIYLLVFAYQIFTPEVAERQEAARELATGWAPALFFVLGACVVAFKVGSWVRSGGVRLGLLVGASAVGVEQTLVFFKYPPVVPNELFLYGLLGFCGGAVGGWFSVLEVARTEAGERVLFNETANIARAEDPDRVAEAIGSLMGQDRVVGVGVWRTDPFGSDAVAQPTGVWEANGPGTFPAAMLLGTVGWRASGAPRNVLADSLSPKVRRVWSGAGVRSAFAGPLIFMGGESLGFMLVGFRRATFFTGASKRRVLSAAAAAGLALEKAERDRRIGVMQERERVRREIHDSIIQELGTVDAQLDAAEMADEAGVSEMVGVHIGRAREGNRRATIEARRLVNELRSEDYNGSTLPETLAVLVKRFSEESGIHAVFGVSGEVRPLDPHAEHSLKRVAQEALSNARKHSGASRVDVSLAFGDGHVTLEVADDGVGLTDGMANEGPREDGGFGMRSMHERAEGIGGSLVVRSSKGAGTRVVFEVPAREGEKDQHAR
jgi:signal transduction histidine kinase